MYASKSFPLDLTTPHSDQVATIDIVPNKAAYYTGEPIEGKVYVTASPKYQGPSSVSSLMLSLHGAVGVGLMKNGEVIDREVRNNLLMKSNLSLSGVNFLPGSRFSLPFSFLPTEMSNLVSTAEWNSGFVRYWIEAALPDFWAHAAPPIGYRKLAIYSFIDTNSTESHSNLPTGRIESISGCCGESGEGVSMTVELRKAVYMPGDVITAICNLSNVSNDIIRPFISLDVQIESCNFDVNQKAKSIRLRPQEGSAPEIPGVFDGQCVVLGLIPTDALLSPTLTHALIKISYAAKVNVEVKGRMITTNSMPITLGTFSSRETSGPVTQQVSRNLLAAMDAGTAKSLQSVYNSKPILPEFDHLPSDVYNRFKSQLIQKASSSNI